MTDWHGIWSWLWVPAVTITALGVGYAWGRRHGLRQGERLALAEAPLRLRAEALERGACPVCDHVAVEPVVQNGRAAPPLATRREGAAPP